MQADDLRFMLDGSLKLDVALEDAAKQTKVDFVDSDAPAGHDACVPEAQRWIEGQQPQSTALAFHPNANAMKAQAKMILAALKKR